MSEWDDHDVVSVTATSEWAVGQPLQQEKTLMGGLIQQSSDCVRRSRRLSPSGTGGP